MNFIPEWRQVPDFPAYEVSNIGQVRRRGKVLRPWFSGESLYRYATVSLSIKGKTIKRAIHSLVLLAFHGPRPEKHEARHLDGNIWNNYSENLKWGTSKENQIDKDVHSRKSELSAKIKEEGLGDIMTQWRKLLATLAAKYDVTDKHIGDIIIGKRARKRSAYL